MSDLRPAWASWASAVAASLLELPDGGTVTITAAAAQVEPLVVRPARWFGLVRAKRRRTPPEVVFTRQEDHLRAECTGDASFGGQIPLSEQARGRMGQLGWHGGGGPTGQQWASYWPDDVTTEAYLPEPLATAASTLVARTLTEVFGCADPGPLEQVAGAPKNPG